MLHCRSAVVQNAPVLDWDDLRYFLAVATGGSTLAAGRTLRVSQTTAARRIAALEATLGLTLFERRQAGYALTEDGEALLASARATAAAAATFADHAAARRRDAAGTVRLTTSAIFAETVLPPMLGDLHDAHPAIRLELDASDEVQDLASGGADVALRSAVQLDGGGLVARRIADDNWTLYCSQAYAAAHGRPATRRDLHGHALIGGGERGVWAYYRQWLEDNGLADTVAMHHGTVTGLLAAVRAGIGCAALPCLVADQDPQLLRCLPPGAAKRSIWLVTHERVRHSPRVRTVIDFLADRLAQLRRG